MLLLLELKIVSSSLGIEILDGSMTNRSTSGPGTHSRQTLLYRVYLKSQAIKRPKIAIPSIATAYSHRNAEIPSGDLH